jgi:hypothetical protein
MTASDWFDNQCDRHCERTFTPEAGGEVKQSHPRKAQFIIGIDAGGRNPKSKVFSSKIF